MNIQEAFEAIESAIANYQDTIQSKKDEIATIDTDIDEATNKHGAILAEIETAKDLYGKEKHRLIAEIEPLRQQYTDLKQAVGKLGEEKGILMRDNAAYMKRHNYLVTYEKRAMKALEAKDQELIQREKKVAEREQMKPLNDSFLPTLNT